MQPNANGDLASGLIFGKWALIERIGRGGNGQVWRARDVEGSEVALKILTKLKPTACQRFHDEVNVMTSCGIKGVVPILDYFLPEFSDKERPWYAMPVGTPLLDFIAQCKFTEKVEHFVDIASVLVELHDKKITHRDIKPANIIVIASNVCLGDFGLVDYPDKTDVTGIREELGPRWTMAPEVRRCEEREELRPADVYSLSKSLWIAITGRQDGFDGRYDGSAAISIKPFAPNRPLKNG